MGQMRMPGPVDPMRLLAAELREGALAEATGLITADV
jgi:predicted N-acetyltransferase YhbS